MKAKVIRYITKDEPEIKYKQEKGVPVFSSTGLLGKIYVLTFFNKSLGNGWFYEDELLFL